MPTGGPFPGQCVGAEGCPRPVFVKKSMLCNSHYVMMRRRENDNPPCSLPWCDSKVYCKNLCQNHWQRDRKGLPNIDPRAPKPSRPPCVGPECDREGRGSTGLCPSHYAQWKLGKPLTPLKKWMVEDNGVERKCRTCKQWKDREEGYYNATGGSKQGECKVCQGRRNSFHQEQRKLLELGLIDDHEAYQCQV